MTDNPTPTQVEYLRIIAARPDHPAPLNHPSLAALRRRGLASVRGSGGRWLWSITAAGLGVIGREA